MKLVNNWTKTLTLGAAALACGTSVFGQGPSVPGKPGSLVKPASFQDSLVINGTPANDYGPMMDAHGPLMDGGPAMGGMPAGMPMDGSMVHQGFPMDGAAYCDDAGCDSMGGPMGMRFGGFPMEMALDGSMHIAGAGPDSSCGQYAEIGGLEMACSNCGYNGCPRCGWGLGLLVKNKLSRIRSVIGPYREAGLADQRWFDISAEALVLSRSKAAGDFLFSTEGSPGTPALSALQADLDEYRVGLSILANLQTGPGANLEFGYFGLNNWDVTVQTPSAGGGPTLFSFISGFGSTPTNGFDDPDRSFRHSINYQSELHNGEINYRRRWVGPYGWLQGSWLAGVRYFDLDEQLTFSARGENNDTAMSNGLRFFDYQQQVRNQLTGFQVGSDLWVNMMPGVRGGIEWKTGVFGNHAEQTTFITANSLPSGIAEGIDDGRTAFLGQLTASFVYRMSYSWAFRSSYQLIYVDNVALAPENINSTPPALFLPTGARTVSINTDGEVLYTGYSLGAEYTW